MRRKVMIAVGSVLLCTALLVGCGGNTADSTSVQQEAADSTAMSEVAPQNDADSAASKAAQQQKAALEDSERKFKSAENYQESGEYFKACALYHKVIEEDSNYTEAQKRAVDMLEKYWKQQDDLVEQGEYQQALENTLNAMSFMNMTSPMDNDMGLERTILLIAKKLAESCGFKNPKTSINENAIKGSTDIYTIDVECDGVNGTSLDSMSESKIIQVYQKLDEKVTDVICNASVGTFCRLLLGNIQCNGKWYNVTGNSVTIRTDEEQAEYYESIKGREPRRTKYLEFWNVSGSKTDSAAVSQENKNALTKAERYYHNMALSKAQIRRQLEYEGFPADAINYAMNHLD